MPEPIDAIMPILHRIQADLSETKRELSGKIDALAANVTDLVERMDTFEDYFTYTMGLTSQNKADIARLSKELKALKASKP
jgi:peptidoglycan hydrolase CwlO-like protein